MFRASVTFLYKNLHVVKYGFPSAAGHKTISQATSGSTLRPHAEWQLPRVVAADPSGSFIRKRWKMTIKCHSRPLEHHTMISGEAGCSCAVVPYTKSTACTDGFMTPLYVTVLGPSKMYPFSCMPMLWGWFYVSLHFEAGSAYVNDLNYVGTKIQTSEQLSCSVLRLSRDRNFCGPNYMVEQQVLIIQSDQDWYVIVNFFSFIL